MGIWRTCLHRRERYIESQCGLWEVFAYFLTGLFYGFQVMGTNNEAIVAKQHSLRKVKSNALDDLD